MSGKFPITRDRDGNIFINRPGKYFEPILEFLITDDVVVPEGMCTKALCREAAFYGIDFPLVEDHISLSFISGNLELVLIIADIVRLVARRKV